jgi:hypothetical protein
MTNKHGLPVLNPAWRKHPTPTGDILQKQIGRSYGQQQRAFQGEGRELAVKPIDTKDTGENESR